MDIMKLLAEVMGLSVFLFAFVAQLKKFGLKGKWLTAAAFVGGLVFGGCYRFFVYPPSTALEWFYIVTFGLAGGFVSTGAYQGIESATGKQQ